MKPHCRWLLAAVTIVALGRSDLFADDDTGKPLTTPPKTADDAGRRTLDGHPLPQPSSEDPQHELKQLRAELEELKRSRSRGSQPPAASPASKPEMDVPNESAELAAERARLKAKLYELLERIPARQTPPSTAPIVDPSHDTNPDSVRPVDRLRYLQNLIKSGQYATALRAFQVMDPASMTGKQGAMLRYLKASAHRRAGDLEAAKQLFAELAQSREDEFLAECAAWQLQAIRMREELNGRLDTTRNARSNR